MLYLSGETPGSSSLDAIPFWGSPRILLTWSYTFLGNPQDPPHLMLYLSGESPGSSSLDAIPFWGTPKILLTWSYTFLGNPQDPPHLMIYLSMEPPGSSSLDDIPFWGIPQNMRKQWWWGWNTDLCSNKDPSGWIDGVNCCILYIWLSISQYVLPASGNLPGIHLNSI